MSDQSLETPVAVSEKLASYSTSEVFKAGKILAVDIPRGHLEVQLQDGSTEIIDASEDFVYQYGVLPANGAEEDNVNVGDYFVVTADSREYWMPAEHFEKFYTKQS